MTTHNILVVEDNIETAQNIKLYLEFNKFACEIVKDLIVVHGGKIECYIN